MFYCHSLYSYFEMPHRRFRDDVTKNVAFIWSCAYVTDQKVIIFDTQTVLVRTNRARGTKTAVFAEETTARLVPQGTNRGRAFRCRSNKSSSRWMFFVDYASTSKYEGKFGPFKRDTPVNCTALNKFSEEPQALVTMASRKTLADRYSRYIRTKAFQIQFCCPSFV